MKKPLKHFRKQSKTARSKATAAEKQMQQEARERWKNSKSAFLEDAVEQMMLTGTSAEEFKVWESWQCLRVLAEDIRWGEPISQYQSPEDIAIAGLVADWLREKWERYRDGQLRTFAT